MKTKAIFLLGISFLFGIFCQTTEAQILQSRTEVVETYGTPFSSGITRSGDTYLYYKTPVKTKSSGTYDQRRVLFFKKADDGTEICYKWKILEPSTETKSNLFSFKDNLVPIGDMQWKDYGKGIVYELKEENGVCKITAWYDNKVELARVYKW